MARIHLDGLAHSYGPDAPDPAVDPAAWALKPLDMVWEDGGAYALLGPSGCGKTTLLNIISGLVQPRRGRVSFGDRDVTALPTERRNIAQVFQFPVVYDTMTVYENLAFPLRNRGMTGADADARVRQVGGLLGLDGVLHRKARGLTADLKQKISLGRGLVRSDVAAILFDEPLTVIDPHLKWQLRAQLKRVHELAPVTMIYVTHDQTEALTFADRVVVMHEGRVVQTGTPQELFEAPAHTFVGYFIGSPGMNVLPAEIAGDRAVVGGRHPVPLARGHAAPPAGARVEIGVRPEFVRIAADGGGVPVRVRRVEDAGRMKIARLELDGLALAAVLPEDARIDGDAARIAMDPDRVHVYVDGWRTEG